MAGDALYTLQQLNKRLSERQEDEFLCRHQQEMKDWLAEMKAQGEEDRTPLRPETVPVALQEVLADDAVLPCDV